MREYVRINGEAFLEARSSSPLWNGLVLHHKDVFVSHVLPKLNRCRSVFLFKSGFRELECACVREGKRIGITLGCLRMFIHFDVGMVVE